MKADRSKGTRLAVRVYSAGSRWVWVVQEFGGTLCSGTATNKRDAEIRGRHARAEIAAVTPGGITARGVVRA